MSEIYIIYNPIQIIAFFSYFEAAVEFGLAGRGSFL